MGDVPRGLARLAALGGVLHARPGRCSSDLKLRASWAKTGNQAFANYQQYATYVLGDASDAGAVRQQLHPDDPAERV